jgi:hypothetical protein
MEACYTKPRRADETQGQHRAAKLVDWLTMTPKLKLSEDDKKALLRSILKFW